MTITCNGKRYELPDSSVYADAAAMIRRDGEESPILLVMENKRLKELGAPVSDRADIVFLSASDPIGNETYRRSVLMVMLKAVHDLYPSVSVRVLFSVSKGIFCLPDSMESIPDFLASVERRMRELTDADIPFRKETISTEEAMEPLWSTARMTSRCTPRLRRA